MAITKDEIISECVDLFRKNLDTFLMFSKSVSDFFTLNSKLNDYEFPIVHSVKSRVKNPEHLKDKLYRKWDNKNRITKKNLFKEINDLAGVRVLHLYHAQFIKIHEEITKKIEVNKEWILVEKPKAYTWDIEREVQFNNIGLDVLQKESHYTSVHYIIKPNNDSIVCCEIQVRTLFEEIWGEIDHKINYPQETKITSAKEQIKVLAKLVNAGSRLADSIFISAEE